MRLRVVVAVAIASDGARGGGPAQHAEGGRQSHKNDR